MRYVVKKGSIKLPQTTGTIQRNLLCEGQPVPEGAFPAPELARLEGLGVICAAPEPEQAPADLALVRRGQWCVDPALLIGKGLAELRIMAGEIDAECPVDGLDEAELVRLLTSDFDLVFRPAPAPVPEDSAAPPRERVERARKRARLEE